MIGLLSFGIFYKFYFLPSHAVFSQEEFCDFLREQGFPFPDGLGLVQPCDFAFVLGPQDLEHSVQSLELVHSPSTPESDPDPEYEITTTRIQMNLALC